MNIIIRGNRPDKFGKTRSEHEKNLRKEWGATMTDEQLDKLKYAERHQKAHTGSSKNFLTGIDIDKIK